MVKEKGTNNYILGISAYYHDSSAVLLRDGEILAAVQEERFTRKKHDPSFPGKAIRYCLEEANLTLDEVNQIVYFEKPFVKLERLLETYLYFAPRGLRSFIAAAIVWIQEKFLLRSLLEKELKKISATAKFDILFSDHHLSHAASAFFPSPFNSAAILTLDGVGEWTTTLLAHGKGNNIKSIKAVQFPHSIGLLYSAFTYYLGFKVNSGEYKLMGLAPYGNNGSRQVIRYVELIKINLITQYEDGSFSLQQKYFNYATGLTMAKDKKWHELFGLKRRSEADDLQQIHCDLALAIQIVTEEMVINLAKQVKKITGEDNLVLAGGVALNCVANQALRKTGLFKNIWVQPASGDAGTALGAALAVHHMFLNHQRIPQQPDSMQGSYLGPAFSEHNIGFEIERNKLKAHQAKDKKALVKEVAKLISEGNVVGWFQGRMEWGPRALGNRSILGDPRNPDMQKTINLRIKFREGFRPFAPSVLAEHTEELFVDKEASPYMLFTTDVLPGLRNQTPDDFSTWSVNDKLYFKRSSVPAVTHIDYSARHQTVHQETNPLYHALIQEFYSLTGCPAVINTSFNVRGEPIVGTPFDAISCFMTTDMDCLVMGNFILNKSEQTVSFQKKEYESD